MLSNDFPFIHPIHSPQLNCSYDVQVALPEITIHYAYILLTSLCRLFAKL